MPRVRSVVGIDSTYMQMATYIAMVEESIY